MGEGACSGHSLEALWGLSNMQVSLSRGARTVPRPDLPGDQLRLSPTSQQHPRFPRSPVPSSSPLPPPLCSSLQGPWSPAPLLCLCFSPSNCLEPSPSGSSLSSHSSPPVFL